MLRTLCSAILLSATSLAPALQPRLDDFESIDLALPDRARAATTVIDAYGKRFELDLEANKDLLDMLPAAARARIGAADRFLRGSVIGMQGSWARLNRVDGRISGAFFDGTHLYLIDRPDGLQLPAGQRLPAGSTIVFRLADLRLDGAFDHGGVIVGEGASGAETPITDYASFSRHLREIVVLEGAAMLAMPVTVVTDVEFSDRHGGTTASVVAGRINLIDGIYADQLGTGIVLHHLEILTDNDVLISTDPGTLLSGERDENFNLVPGGQPGFQQFMTDGSGWDIPFAGLAHLFTGKNLNGSTVGIAYLDVLCNSGFGFGVDQDLTSETTAMLVAAHELGHNFAAGHDDDPDACPGNDEFGIMNSSINGSQQFSGCSLDSMGPAVAEAGCLVETSDAIFASSFEP